MPGTERITIRRQVLDVAVEGTEAEALALQRRLPSLCAAAVSPALEAELALLDPGDAHLYVDRLELELPPLALGRLEGELADALRRALAELLSRHAPSWCEVEDPGATTEPLQLRSRASTVDGAFIHFLTTGRLPWSFRLPAGARLEQLVADSWGRSSPSGGLSPSTSTRLAAVLSDPISRRRLFMQFPHRFVRDLLQRWSPGAVATADEVVAVAAHGDALSQGARAAFIDAVWEAAVATAATGRSSSAAGLARAAWEWRTVVPHERRALAALLEARWPGVTTADSPREGAAPAGNAVRPEAARRQPSLAEPEEESDGLLVADAGIVLLHPFLPQLFEELGVADGDELVDPHRALFLLHQLATGERTAAEHQLTLAKVLCGLPLAEPVSADIELTEAECAEATALLQAAVRHWAALRGTSPDGLRGEFLARPGILTPDPSGGWLLRVESRASDILLDQLPWGISMVRLPWMGDLLRTEWR